jgi:hypothetical protein
MNEFKKKFPLVSVIVLNYNGSEFLEECLSSIMKQKYPNREILFIDNASTDESLHIAEKKFPGLRIIKNSNNLGFAGGMNTGIRHASGDMIALVNIDTKLHPDWLEELVHVAQKDPLVGACSGKEYDYDGREEHVTSYGIDKNLMHLDCLQEVSTVYGSAFLVSRRIIDVVGMLDEKFFMYFDEVDWCWRMRLAGFKCIHVPTAIVYHKVGGSAAPQAFKIYLNIKNQVRSILKNCGIIALFLYLSLMLTKFLFACLKCISFKENKRVEGRVRFLQYLKAYLWNLLNLRDTIQERVRVQKTRKISDRCLHLYDLTLSYGYTHYNIGHR